LQAGKHYRITAFGRANELRSNGAVSIVVDAEWKSRPIQLPQGTYGWTELTGMFVAGKGRAQLRILSEDAGEAWLDDIRIVEE
jgi:hypothetical protein